jgi:hypothetical protein
MDNNSFEEMMRNASPEVRRQYYEEAQETLADPRKLATQAFASGMYLEDARASNQEIIAIIEKVEHELGASGQSSS